ncbi:hypothetical protein LN565_01165 [Xanthomonas euvesicatoria pv. euvesicatoria]|uniref:hypothetical protein n=1 Tax=Xanthomonas euvesicatoria TaxID=456327 RepID=UPI000A6DF62F|nr:hypothetical protein [Xanthomonas euvesicatoria]MCC8569037.1 hypothetical protein [Xanthomonas euvesicatoria pv. euvesicatoria]MCC8575604.1 hypothetical protein [Xanthomonas euvesicatoria pv. euvesicatoria]MCC8764800.1 hypothetical protein [Xanthomonas euvesicatoria pv. euvesicatoria]MCC8777573.1 hypothetical protein [Xanthomonas euvesicatoria pv. euvesicatoria]MCC8783348.1 hypothetical protein [Xanthomonas euvesicatoria pv. euvesicatoria]
MPKYNDGSALAVLFRLPQADDGLYVVATTDDNDQDLCEGRQGIVTYRAKCHLSD